MTEIRFGAITNLRQATISAGLRVREVIGRAAWRKGELHACSAELYFNSAALAPVINKPQSYKTTLRYPLLMGGTYAWAQNLGGSPQTNVAVQGETGAQPEGAFLNFVNWIGNVIAPVGAGGAVVGAIIAWLTGRGFGRWLFAAGALLGVSGLTGLLEFRIANGTGGVGKTRRVEGTPAGGGR